jgi:hypothetical protein
MFEKAQSAELEAVRSLMNTPLETQSEKSEIGDEKTRSELWFELRNLCYYISEDTRVSGKVIHTVTVERLEELRTRMENRSYNFTQGLSKDLSDTKDEIEKYYLRAIAEILRIENEQKAEALRLQKEQKAEALRLQKEERDEKIRQERRRDDMMKFGVTVIAVAAVVLVATFKICGRR